MGLEGWVASTRSWGDWLEVVGERKTALEFAEGWGVMGYWGSGFADVYGDVVSGGCGEMEGEIDFGRMVQLPTISIKLLAKRATLDASRSTA